MSTEILSPPENLAARVRHQIEAGLNVLVGRVRHALDLPSRAELMDLTRRLEELDRRIAALAAERVEAMSTVIPALSETSVSSTPAEPEETIAAESASDVADTAGDPASEAAAVAEPAPNGSKRGPKHRKR
jgi:hypothetical protein